MANGPGPYEGIYNLADAIKTGIMNIAGWLFGKFGTADQRRAFLSNVFPDSPPSLIYSLHDQMAESLTQAPGIMAGGPQTSPVEQVPGGVAPKTYVYVVQVDLVNTDKGTTSEAWEEIVVYNDGPLSPEEIMELAMEEANTILAEMRSKYPDYFKGWGTSDYIGNYSVTSFYIMES